MRRTERFVLRKRTSVQDHGAAVLEAAVFFLTQVQYAAAEPIGIAHDIAVHKHRTRSRTVEKRRPGLSDDGIYQLKAAIVVNAAGASRIAGRDGSGETALQRKIGDRDGRPRRNGEKVVIVLPLHDRRLHKTIARDRHLAAFRQKRFHHLHNLAFSRGSSD